MNRRPSRNHCLQMTRATRLRVRRDKYERICSRISGISRGEGKADGGLFRVLLRGMVVVQV